MRNKLAGPLIAVVAVLLAGATSPSVTSTQQGAYTDEQADAGALLYAGRCAMCHGKMLEGTFETPGLQGKFMANWSKAPVANLYDYIGRAMPQFAPGSLKPDETVSLVAFLLKTNGLPAGSQPLPSNGAALQRIMLEPSRPVAPAPKDK